MAANNYFNFTHGGTQYGTTPTGAYNQYTVSPATTSGYNTSRPGGYDQQAYHAAAAASQGSYANTGTPAPTYDYGYGRYDKAYYQQAPGYAGAAPAAPYDNAAGTGKVPGYQAATTYAQQRPAMTGAKVSQYSAPGQQYPTQASYPQLAAGAAPVAPTTGATPTYSNYDAAVYNATTVIAAQQGKVPGVGPVAPTPATVHPYKKPSMGGAGPAAVGKMRFNKPGQAKPQQLHYCEVCRISCAGPQTYREHLEGQKHKKRQAGLKLSSIGGAGSAGSRGSTMTCQLCDVACTGADAYAAHVRGSKHQKVVKLHQKLGKPIPEQDALPLAVPAAKKVAKINFVSESQPSMTVDGTASAEAQGTTETVGTQVTADGAATAQSAGGVETQFSPPVDIKPVGQEYIEEIRDESGKMLSFNCKLCDCKFNDPNAKEMHMKGRRHRLQYKKKVQPDLVVDLKPSPRRLKLAEAKNLRNRRFTAGEGGPMIMDDEDRRYWETRERMDLAAHMGWMGRPLGDGMGRPMGAPAMVPWQRPESSDDRYVVAKHAEIYPKEAELQVIQRIVSHTERALKFVSDALAIGGAAEKKAPEASDAATEANATPANAAENEKKPTENGQKEDGRDNQMFSFHKEGAEGVRVLKGVMRVGLLAKGLLLQGDTVVQLVVLCAEKPTQGLLKRVATELPVQLANISSEFTYQVTVEKGEGAVFVTDGQITVKVSLTSPLLREQHPPDNGAPTAVQTAVAATTNATPAAGVVGSDDELLPREPCLAALAALRHAKWFQARATGIQSGVMVMRVFRDLCQRNPTWNAIPQWAMELLIEKIITSGMALSALPLSPGDCVRRIMEAVASGLLINGPGVMDPCEKEPTDALACLTKQQREDITVSGQHFLRCVAFRKIYEVLGMEIMLPPNFASRGAGVNSRFVRKRRRSGTDATAGEGDSGTESTVKISKTEATDAPEQPQQPQQPPQPVVENVEQSTEVAN